MRLPSLRLPRILKLGPRKWSEALAVNSKLLVAAPLAFTLIVGTGVIARSHRNDDEARPASAAQAPRVALAPKAEAAPPAPAAVQTPPAAQPAQQKAEEPKSVARESKASHPAKDPAPKANVPVQTARAGETAAAAPAPTPKPREPETIAISPTRDGTINIVALPWAEVFIDGNRQGVSPPLKAIPLRPGKHRVELRNGSFPPHVQTVELRPGAEVSVTHRFRR
jgi:outer membrane biosynthesis protein TonB